MRWTFATAALLGALLSAAQRSPFNGLGVLPADSNGHYRILIGGHFHGASTNRSGYPASTLLANLDTINKLGANLFLSTGDLFMDAEKDRARYERAFFSKLKVPFFNAPGNHDFTLDHASTQSGRIRETITLGYLPALGRTELESLREGIRLVPGDALDSTYRKTVRRLFEKSRAFDSDSLWTGLGACLVLDLEATGGSFSDQQLEDLRFWQKVAQMGRVPWGGRLFVISHRPIWAEGDPRYADLFKDNTRSLTGTNFHRDVYPLLEKIAERAHVYWISGSLGGNAPSSIFFQEHAPNITYIQCAIRDEPRDALLIADVYPDSVKWSAFSLTGQQLLAPETYNASWWRERVGRPKGFNWRLLPLLAKNTVAHRAFWWGVGAALLLSFVLRRLFRRGR